MTLKSLKALSKISTAPEPTVVFVSGGHYHCAAASIQNGFAKLATCWAPFCVVVSGALVNVSIFAFVANSSGASLRVSAA